MTTIVDILTRAGRQCSVEPPPSWVTATQGTHLELKDFLSETVEDILDRISVTRPISKNVVIEGDGGGDYALPSDLRRVDRDALTVYESDGIRRRGIPVSSDGEWTALVDFGASGAERFYRIRGYPGAYRISIFPDLAVGESLTLHYVSNVWAQNAGIGKEEFTAEDDDSLLPRRIVESGIVYRFRERKGLDYTAKRQEYETLLARLSNDGRTRRVVDFGGRQDYNPFNVPVPDFIPGS